MTVSDLKLSMEHAALPWGLLERHSLQMDFANKALHAHLRAYFGATAASPLLALQKHPSLRQAAAKCLVTGEEVTAQAPQTAFTWHFSPVFADQQIIAVQCYVLLSEVQREQATAPTDRFETFLDHLPYHVWIATPHGELTWLNRSLTQYAYDHTQRLDLQGGMWIDLVHPQDLITVNAELSRALITGQLSGYRLRVKSHSGPYQWFYSSLAPVKDEQDQILYWVGSNINIENVKDTEDHLRDQIIRNKHQLSLSQQELEQLRAELAQVQKMDMVSRLSAGVAHDLNNLLFITGLHASLLERKVTHASQREHVDIIHDSIKKAGRLASQLTGFSSRKSLQMSSADPAQLVRDMELLLNKAAGDDIAFDVQLGNKLWPVNVDRMYFENSLINLCINARDAIDGKGRISLTLENTQRLINGSTEDFVMISVRDDGSGMDEAIKAQIFEMFYTTKPEGKGAGLGLSMVKNFMDHCQGVIEVDSEPGKGSCFKLLFPRAELVQQHEASSKPIEQGHQEVILLIEDDLSMRNAMAQVLYELGYQVVTAYRPEVAQRYISNGLKVNLIVASVRMPGQLSAMEMHRQLQEQQMDIPMLLTTGQSSESAKDLTQSGYSVLFKPAAMPDLAQAVHQLLHPAAEAAQPAN
jgi:PAS domain S-box-containing protein